MCKCNEIAMKKETYKGLLPKDKNKCSSLKVIILHWEEKRYENKRKYNL